MRAPSRDVLGELAELWSLPRLRGPLPPVHRDGISLDLAAVARGRATTRLLAFMGLHDVVREQLAGKPMDAMMHEWAAEAAWTAGQYREAAAHWSAATPGEDSESGAARAEREAAVNWLRGRLRVARRQLVDSLRAAECNGVSPAERLVMAATLGRVLQHMRRMPDTSLLVTRARRAEALAYLDSAESNLAEPLGVHIWARVEDIREFLAGGRRGDHEQSVHDFKQSEALLAMLNYRGIFQA